MKCIVSNADGIESSVTIISHQRLNSRIEVDVDIVSLNVDIQLYRKIASQLYRFQKQRSTYCVC